MIIFVPLQKVSKRAASKKRPATAAKAKKAVSRTKGPAANRVRPFLARGAKK